MTTNVRVDDLSVGQFVTEAYNADGKLLISQFTVSNQRGKFSNPSFSAWDCFRSDVW